MGKFYNFPVCDILLLLALLLVANVNAVLNDTFTGSKFPKHINKTYVMKVYLKKGIFQDKVTHQNASNGPLHFPIFSN